MENSIRNLIENLPEAQSAQRFLDELEKRDALIFKRLRKNTSLLSDILTLASHSPFLAATLLQNPTCISWLERQRKAKKIRDKEELLDSLARFSATNSGLEAHVLLSRFRRRELLRIYLLDLRNLATIAEITEELSNLADAILESALRLAQNEIHNRFGAPLETDEKGRTGSAQFCIVSLGKLGSKELNYASDIDLLFLYSKDGTTSGAGTKGTVTNREYFGKLAELVSKIVGEAKAEGAAYRVDLRLRPHGRVGALAVSVKEAVNYYQKTARDWERQVLLRSRSSAGNPEVFKNFANTVESIVYQPDIDLQSALENVRLSKQKINLEHASEKSFNVKLGKGGIREIEFIAQALQLAFGGRDEWLRASHTLISLSRLNDRNLLSEHELTALSEAYGFLRTLEHRLQMENGLQTHAVSNEPEKRAQIARKMNFSEPQEFSRVLHFHAANVSAVFERVFETVEIEKQSANESGETLSAKDLEINNEEFTLLSAEEKTSMNEKFFSSGSTANAVKILEQIYSSLEKSEIETTLSAEKVSGLLAICETSSHFAEMIAANPKLIENLPLPDAQFQGRNYQKNLTEIVRNAANFYEELAALRMAWAQYFLEIGAFEIFGKIEMRESNRLQTELAEASLSAATIIAGKELTRKVGDAENPLEPHLTILGLGKLGSRGMDFGSDLDLVLTFDNEKTSPLPKFTNQEFYAKTVEILVTSLSSLTREGHLYRVDLRLRPDGKNGATCTSKTSFFNYLQNRAAIWELLAYLKIRAVTGEKSVETEAREIIHQKARETAVAELKNETRRVREMLEINKTKDLRRGEIDIKYGAGGLLDVYFAVRFLQLRDDVRDTEEIRGTSFMLRKLHENGSLNDKNFRAFAEGYEFLRRFDHTLRLTHGRSARLPNSESPLAEKIAARLKLDSVAQMLHLLNVHRIQIRETYRKIFVTD